MSKFPFDILKKLYSYKSILTNAQDPALTWISVFESEIVTTDPEQS